MFRFAPEGIPYIGITSVASVITYLLSLKIIAVIFFFLFLFMLYFFRDPKRKIPSEKNIFLSPADGKVILIKEIKEKAFLDSPTQQISIFMSPLNVHINRCPCDGIVKLIKYTPGNFKAAYTDKAAISNENVIMVLNTSYGIVIVKQIAGILARRVVCHAKVGEKLRMGQRYGIIKFGSRVDLFLPKTVKIVVKEGDKVKAGETIVAKWREDEKGCLSTT